jgi:DHA2 family multidrug resistance protein-like MFS transporter
MFCYCSPIRPLRFSAADAICREVTNVMSAAKPVIRPRYEEERHMAMQDTTAQGTPRKASRREWIGLAVIALPCLLYSMDLTVLNLAVPAITADLNPSATELLWIVDIYGFMIAGALITMGTLGDRIGRRKLLMIGAFAFGLASVLAAFASSARTRRSVLSPSVSGSPASRRAAPSGR